MPVTENDVQQLIDDMSNKKSCGYDEISSFVLKFVAGDIAKHLAYLINMSFTEGEFPRALKPAVVIPVHKKSDAMQCENYRPIALLSAISKIFERTAYNQFSSFLNKNNILTQKQHGFRKRKSTETALVELTQYVFERLDDNQLVAGIFFDLTRAFDCVDQDILYGRIECLGIRGLPLEWLKSYLTDRTFAVRVGNVHSRFHDVNLGVPQGSILGPLLFLLMANDLPQYFSDSEVTLYADDTSIIVSAVNNEKLFEKINTAIAKMELWCRNSRIILNMDKTAVIYFHKRKDVPCFPNLTLSHTGKILGIFINEQMTWTDHVEYVCNKLNQAYYALRHLKNILSRDCLVSIYFALVQSVLTYNVIVWGQATDWTRVFIAQKRILRLIFNLNHRESCKNTFLTRKILSFPCIYLYKCAVYFKEHEDKFKVYKSAHTYMTRNADRYVVPQHNLTAFKKSPIYACITIYNHLPHTLKSIQRVTVFKGRLKLYLASACFYSINDFFSNCNDVIAK